MKSLKVVLFAILIVSPFLLLAQSDKPKRPDNISVSNIDDFKNNSFDISDESASLKTDVNKIDSEIKNYSGAMNSVSAQKLSSDYKTILDLNKSTKALKGKLGKLQEVSQRLLGEAKDVTPKMKSMSAVSNTNKAISGLDYGRKNITEIITLLKNNATLLSTEMKKRGEPVEEFVE